MKSLEIELKKIWYMMLANFWVRFLFMFGIAMELVNMLICHRRKNRYLFRIEKW